MALADNSLREVYRGRDVDCTVTGLSPGRPYLFQVRAFNKAGVSRQYILFLSFPSLPLIPYPLLQILTLLPSLPLLSHLLSTLSFPPYFSSVPLPFLHSPPFRLSLFLLSSLRLFVSHSSVPHSALAPYIVSFPPFLRLSHSSPVPSFLPPSIPLSTSLFAFLPLLIPSVPLSLSYFFPPSLPFTVHHDIILLWLCSGWSLVGCVGSSERVLIPFLSSSLPLSLFLPSLPLTLIAKQ